ncbi:MAG: glycosyltransferase 2 family protein [Solirubrobacteraceae bacterium]|jgi:uncharacterized membrane protein YbhN (UPF0104 family)|nr:glycosyltransferase 2 family protein [Solirubrobacteraceae bacterium]
MSPALRRVLAGAVLVATAIALAGRWGDLREGARGLHAGPVAAALALAAAGTAATMLAWRAVLADLGSPLRTRPAARFFFVAQLGKYLPGGVWPFLTHMELGRELRLPRHRTATALALTLGLSLLTALLVAAATLSLVGGDRARDYAPLLLAVPVLALSLRPRTVQRVLDWTLRRLGRESLERVPTWRGVLSAAGWLVAAWALYGAHTWVLARHLGGTADELPALGTGAFALSWALGLIVVFAPAGVGVREAVLVALLSASLGSAGATTLAVASRLLLVAADVLCAGVATLTAVGAGDRLRPRGAPRP